jgi:hypothetical protein
MKNTARNTRMTSKCKHCYFFLSKEFEIINSHTFIIGNMFIVKRKNVLLLNQLFDNHFSQTKCKLSAVFLFFSIYTIQYVFYSYEDTYDQCMTKGYKYLNHE